MYNNICTSTFMTFQLVGQLVSQWVGSKRRDGCYANHAVAVLVIKLLAAGLRIWPRDSLVTGPAKPVVSNPPRQGRWPCPGLLYTLIGGTTMRSSR